VVLRTPVTLTRKQRTMRLLGAGGDAQEMWPGRAPYRPRRYTAGDVALLAAVDAAHQDLSGPAVRHILWREFHIFGQPQHERLAGSSSLISTT